MLYEKKYYFVYNEHYYFFNSLEYLKEHISKNGLEIETVFYSDINAITNEIVQDNLTIHSPF